MWHWPQVEGRRARATELVWREWQLVQVPMVPSSLGLPMAWHCSQPETMAEVSLGSDEGMRRPPCASGLVLLAEVDLCGAEALLAIDGGPTGRGVAAVQELLVDALVATAAVAGGELGADDKAVMVLLLLAFGGLVAVQAVDAFFGVGAHLVLMHHRVLEAGVALGALAAGANKVRRWLVGFDLGAGAIDQECGKNQRKGNGNSDKHRAEGHG